MADDRKIWHLYLKDVAPLTPEDLVTPPAATPTADATRGAPLPKTGATATREKSVRPLDQAPRRLVLQAQLDLHGFTVPQAELLLERFLRKAQQRQYKCVLIITGKGKRSADETGVLRRHFAHWMEKFRTYVHSFCPAGPKDGGSGAFYVFIRSGK